MKECLGTFSRVLVFHRADSSGYQAEVADTPNILTEQTCGLGQTIFDKVLNKPQSIQLLYCCFSVIQITAMSR